MSEGFFPLPQGDTQQARLVNACRRYAALLTLGLLYLGFVTLTGWSLPCPIKAITGFSCPGCGITHAALALAHGDLAGAFAANPALLTASPLLLGLLIRDEAVWIHSGHAPVVPDWLSLLLLLYFLVFTVWRNLA